MTDDRLELRQMRGSEFSIANRPSKIENGGWSAVQDWFSRWLRLPRLSESAFPV